MPDPIRVGQKHHHTVHDDPPKNKTKRAKSKKNKHVLAPPPPPRIEIQKDTYEAADAEFEEKMGDVRELARVNLLLAHTTAKLNVSEEKVANLEAQLEAALKALEEIAGKAE